MEERIQAACYIRVSTEDQTEYSPDAQKRALENYAQQHGMSLSPANVYVDAGISGRRAVTRPAFMEMIAAAKRKPPPFSVILVHKFDRFARSREDSIVYKSMLRRQCGVQVISITEQLEDDRMGLILEAMLEAMAEYYSINLGEEVRKGMTEKARRGGLQTAPPFGYRVSDNNLTPVPAEARIVADLFRRYLAGESMAAMARWARVSGVLSHRGNPLDSRGIRYILGNPAYIGKLRWSSGEESVVADSGHPPLIEEEVFWSVQDRLREQTARHGRHAQPGGARRHWLAGLVRCAACGGGMVFSAPHFLRCGRYVKGKCTVSQHIAVEKLERTILDCLRQDITLAGSLQINPVSWPGEEADLSRQAAALERKLERLREAYLCGAETAKEYGREKSVLLAQKRELIIRKEKTESEPQMSQVELQAASDRLDFPEADCEALYRAACAVLSACIWNREASHVTLIYRWEPK